MKQWVALLVVCIGYISLYGQNDTAYVYTYGGIQNDVCNQVKPTYDGGYIMIGTTNSFGCGNTSFYAIKTDSLCNHEWSKTYGGAVNQEGFSVATTFDHGYAFVGLTDSYGAGGYDVFLVKTDSLGNEQWEKTYGGSDWDFGYSIQQLPDSGYIICGLTYSYGGGNGDVYVIRTNKNGDTVWTRAIGGSGYYSIANSVCVHEDSLYFIAGANTSLYDGDTNTFLMEIDSKGYLNWDTTYHSIHSNEASSIRGTSDNGFIIYGFTDSVPGSDTLLNMHTQMMVKTDDNGKAEWTQIYYNSITVETGKDAIECSNGNYLTVGTIFGGGAGSFQMNIQNTSPGGWYQNGLLFQGGVGDEVGNSIAYKNNRNIVFAGSTTSGAGDFDFYLVRFTSDSLQSSYELVKKYYIDTTLLPVYVPVLNTLNTEVKVFPNPMTSSATVLIQGEINMKYLFNLFDMDGKMLLQNMPMNRLGHGQSSIFLDKKGLSSGSYQYTILNSINGNIIASGKIIVE